jgi:hypothetical protein
VIPDFIHSEPLLRVRVENSSDQVLALAAQELGQSVVGTHDFFVEIGGLGVFERQVATDHGVENHATAPDVGLESVVAFASNHFGSSITGRPAGSLESGIGFVHVAEAEVDDLESEVVVEQQVLRLEVSVADSTLVDVLNARDEF